MDQKGVKRKIKNKKTRIRTWERGERENQKKNKMQKNAISQIHEKKIQNVWDMFFINY